jgi:KDO2-lipid IV(A) lauroyltransferase
VGRASRAIRHELRYWALRLLLGGARPLPLSLLRAGGSLLGLTALALSRQSRRHVRHNLELAYPDQPDVWREALARRVARHSGMLLGEVAWLWSVGPRRLLARTRFEGLEHLQGCRAAERGAVLITGHCGNWEWMNLALGAAGVPMSVAARQVDDPRIDEVVGRLRGRFGGRNEVRGEGAGRRLIAALRASRVAGLLIDQDIDAPGAFVPFFGRPAWTPTGAATLALRVGVPIVAGFATRLEDGTMRLSFDPPIAPDPRGDLDEAAARLTAACTARIEAQVRAWPDQWVWVHRRWRRTPQANERVWHADGSVRPAGA